MANPPIPVAAFSGAPLGGTTPLSVAFTDASTNSPTSWLWDFGDGHTSTLQNPTYQFNSTQYYYPETFTVKLTATNTSGSDTVTKTNYITVNPLRGFVMLSLMPYIINQWFDDNGKPLAGGFLNTYTGGVGGGLPIPVFTDPTGNTSYPNPIVLNSAGRTCGTDGTPSAVWLTPGQMYKFVVTDILGNVVWQQDNYLAGGGANAANPSTVPNITALRAILSPIDKQMVYMSGLTIGGGGSTKYNDGTQGWYYFEAASTLTDDTNSGARPGTVSVAGDGTTGRWLRIIESSVNIRWFGAVGDGLTDDSGAIAAAASVAKTLTAPLLFPGGNFYCVARNPDLSSVKTILSSGAVYKFFGMNLQICPIIRDISQHFDITAGSSAVAFVDLADGTKAPANVYPEWFGAKGDNSTDDTNAINGAIKAGSFYSPGGLTKTINTVLFTSHQGYKVTSKIIPQSGTVLKGIPVDLINKAALAWSSWNGAKIIQAGAYDLLGDNGFDAINGLVIKDLALEAASGKLAINFTNGANVNSNIMLDNVMEQTTSYGFAITGNNIIIKNCYSAGPLKLNYSSVALISNNTLDQIVVDSNSDKYLIEKNTFATSPWVTEGVLNVSTPSKTKSGIVKNNTPNQCNDDFSVCFDIGAPASGNLIANGFLITWAMLPIGFNQFNLRAPEVFIFTGPLGSPVNEFIPSYFNGGSQPIDWHITPTGISLNGIAGHYPANARVFVRLTRYKQPSIDVAGTYGTLWTPSGTGT